MVAVELLHAISVDTRRENTPEQVSITPQVSGRIVELNIKTTSWLTRGIFCSRSIKRPFSRRAERTGSAGESAI